MSNELIRRLEETSSDLTIEDKMSIVDKYTQQLINSEYSWKSCREIVICGLKGWLRKEARKCKLGIPRFRSGQSSLKARSDKKLTEKYSWFKKVNNDENDEESDINDKINDKMVENRKNKWRHYDKKKQPIEALEDMNSERLEAPPKAVN